MFIKHLFAYLSGKHLMTLLALYISPTRQHDLHAVQGTLKSSLAQFESISSSAFRLLYGPALTWTSCSLKEINPEYSLERLMLKLQYFGHLMRRTDSLEKTLMVGKTEGRRRG